MAPIDDELLDKLLSRHVASRLDGHLGRAEAAFRQRLEAGEASFAPPAAGDAPSPLRLTSDAPFARGPRRRQWGGGAWLAGIAGTALAASLATLWVLPHLAAPPAVTPGRTEVSTGPSTGGGTALAATGDQPTIRYVHNRSWDEGTVTPAGTSTPMRRVRRQQVEHVQWYDPTRGAKVEVIVPHENVELYELDTY